MKNYNMNTMSLQSFQLEGEGELMCKLARTEAELR